MSKKKIMLNLFQNFFAPQGAFPPCGMFTPQHIAAASLCTAISVFSALMIRKKINDITLNRMIRISAFTVTALEGIKIYHALHHGNYAPDAWVPLSFCSIFILSAWLFLYSEGAARDAAETYLAFSAPIAGIGFMLIPATSLMNYPIWHFLSIYSLLFHSLMIFTGLTLFFRIQHLSPEKYSAYSVFVLSFCIISTVLNSIFKTNFMSLREPYNNPLVQIQTMYSASPALYTILFTAVYLTLPLAAAALTGKLNKPKRSMKRVSNI